MHILQNDIICAVKDDNDLAKALTSNSNNIFLLKANINTVSSMVERCHSAGKKVYIHIDLAEGFGRDEATIRYISQVVKPDGILSTKVNIVKLAKEMGMVAILRVFLIDQQSMDSAAASVKKLQPDGIEIMPGIAYEAIRELTKLTDLPIIAGGFVRTKESANMAFQAGAIACSTSKKELWN